MVAATSMAVPIGFLRHNFLARSETFIYSSMQALEDGGEFSVRVFACRRYFAERFPWDDVTMPGTMSRVLYLATRWAPAFIRWARTVKLVHAHLGQAGPFAMSGALRAGIPFVVSYYGQDVMLHRSSERFAAWAWWYMLLRRRVFERAAKIVVLSEHMKQALVAQGCPADKLAIVRVAVDLSRFTLERIPSEGPLRVLMIGREVDKKGFDDGLRACKALLERGVRCEVTLLGTGGPLKAELEALATELSLDVKWPEPSTPVPQALAAADVVLVPSRTAASGDQEGTPTVIVEAGAARVPIVSTHHAGIPEQVVDGVTGYLAGERDVRGLTEALAKLAGDPALRTSMGEAARMKMEREYSLAAHRAGLEQLYGSVLQGVTS